MYPKCSILGGILDVLHRRYNSSCLLLERGYAMPAGRGFYNPMHIEKGGLHFIATGCNNTTTITSNVTSAEDDKNNRHRVSLPPTPTSKFPDWARWMLGSFMSMLLPPFWQPKMRRVEDTLRLVDEDVENVAKVVEKVAGTAEKISEELAENLPDNSKLKQAALLVEHVSHLAVIDAKFTQDLLHKVDELKEDLEAIDVMVKPVIDTLLVDKRIISREEVTYRFVSPSVALYAIVNI